MCLYAVRRGAPEPQSAAWFAGTAEQRRQPTERLLYTSLGQTLRQCTIAPASGRLQMQMQPRHIAALGLPVAHRPSLDRDKGPPYSPKISPHVDKADTLSGPSADSNNSGPIACRLLWPACFLFTWGTTPPSHPGISTTSPVGGV